MALPASAKTQIMTKPAERGGFEPPIESLIPITVFETAAFDHSATSPVEKLEGRKLKIDDRQQVLQSSITHFQSS